MASWAQLKKSVGQWRIKSWLYSTYESGLRAEITAGALPRHIAVLADGNRRWARLNAPGAPLQLGYQAGAKRLEQFVSWCDEVEIPVITLWVLSTENLQRASKTELEPLLLVITELAKRLSQRTTRQIKMVGDLELLPSRIRNSLQRVAADTASREAHLLNIAVAYGGRHEIRDAFRSLLLAEARCGKTLEEVSKTLEIEDIEKHLYTAGQPDPDLIIRTSGEQRLSGFLMWQSAHSEFYFCEALWPDFRKVDFFRALRSYTQRERRYGR